MPTAASIPSLYRKPFWVAGILALAGVGLLGLGVVRAEASHNQDWYAACAFGVLLLISGVVTAAVYGALELKFRRLISGQGVLLDWTLPPELQEEQARRLAADIVANNKAVLAIMVGFCLLFAIILPFGVKDGDGPLMAGICLGLAVFLSVTCLVITLYRVRKAKRGHPQILLSAEAAYVNGELHSWTLPGTSLDEVEIHETEKFGRTRRPAIVIRYTETTRAGPNTHTVVVPIPDGKRDEAEAAIQVFAIQAQSTRD